MSGAFSLTRQAIQLGYAPLLTVEHTSAWEMGQVYVPQVNWFLAICNGREGLFVFMSRNAVRATAFFKLPPERVVELGVQVEM